MAMEIDLLIQVDPPSPSAAFTGASSRLTRSPLVDYQGQGLEQPSSSFWTHLAMSPTEAVLTLTLLSALTATTVVGNVLVILSVVTYKPLRIAPQNFFLVSLAVADIAVAMLVLPLSIAHSLMGHWAFGLALCQLWLTCDVLCCTASILGISAVALDRYWAIHDPIAYAQKRTLNRVVVMILAVWLLSAIICLPPLVGWNDWGSADDFNSKSDAQCRLTQQRGYIIYSASGSFFLPLVVMTAVYAKIFVATRRRLRERRARCNMAAILVRKPCMVNANSTVTAATPSQQSDTNTVTGSKAVMIGLDKASSSHSSTSASIEAETAKNDVLVCSHASKPDLESPPPCSSCKLESKQKSTGSSPWKLDVDVVRRPSAARSPPDMFQFVEERQRISLSKERRAARILGVIMGVFIVCWLPFFIMYVAVPFCRPSCSPSVQLENFITWLGYANSALNPVIYTIFNVDFRRAFARLLRCRSTMQQG